MRSPARSRRLPSIILLAMSSGAARLAAAQQPPALHGVVRDAATDRGLAGAVVVLGAAADARTVRTDETGAFSFRQVEPGGSSLAVRRLGYEPASLVVDIEPGMDTVVVRLRRVAWLDTVRIRATRQGLYGAVGTSRVLRPLPDARVEVFGATRAASVDSSGHFYVPIKTPGVYMVRATARGYAPQTMSVTIKRDEGTEVALLLDSARGPESRILNAGFADLTDRLLVRRRLSALVSRSELTRDGDHQLLGALRRSPSFMAVSLRFGDLACVFVDGQPKPGVSVNAFDPEDIEAVEVYSSGSEASGTLARRWPNGFPCAPTGNPVVSNGSDLVHWVVIWLRH